MTAADQVTVTGHAEDVSFQSLARTVVVMTREEIQRLPAESIADLLAYAASVDVQSRGPFGVQSDFALRGATFGQTLVLLNGVRLNDSQTGHHNGDIPVPLNEIERIEIVMGPGSSLYGADAFGGTINVITRRSGTDRELTLTGGAFGLVSGDASLATTAGGVREAVAVSANRANGFEPDRDFRTLDLSSQTTFGNGVQLWVSHLRKDFGAAGYYGPALSTERTNQTLVSLDGATRPLGAWSGHWQTSYRTHGDVFLYDSTQPGTPNQHRDHAIDATGRLQRLVTARTRVTIGAEVGADWIHSNNLGDHDLLRGSVFGEVQQQIGSRTFIYPGVRVDGYSTFGSAVSPALSAVTWVGNRVKLHASAGRAFRVPTFTERFYVDPNNLGTPTLVPEHAWSSEIGADWIAARQWTVGGALFDRQASDTIDFVRASVLDRWQAANIRHVETRGLELTTRRTFGTSSSVSARYTLLDASTGALPLFSEYVLDYARHTIALSASASLPAQFSIGQKAEYKRRRDGIDYWLVDTRVGRTIGPATVFVEGSNLLDTHYQEVSGVDMPGRWIRLGVRLGSRGE
ncbi:MAG TPA: TonB-dependent receptor [Vicinamibacterales bacterium]|nr:TonB-dependent receptor [Vicinamibacterales bacterium]